MFSFIDHLQLIIHLGMGQLPFSNNLISKPIYHGNMCFEKLHLINEVYRYRTIIKSPSNRRLSYEVT